MSKRCDISAFHDNEPNQNRSDSEPDQPVDIDRADLEQVGMNDGGTSADMAPIEAERVGASEVAEHSASLEADERMALEGDLAAEEEYQALDKRSVTLDRISSFIFTAVLAVGAIIASSVSLVLQQWIGWWWLAVPASCFAFICLLAWLSYYWPGLSYRYARYRLADTGLEIRRGVLWRHQISVPAARVQHVDVAQGPVQRNFGLATLIVHTAGTTNASVSLEGLSFDTAQQLRDELIRQRESLDVL